MDDFFGFEELSDYLSQCIKNTDESKVLNVLEVGADCLVKDLLKLPRPYSKITSPGYTHLVKTFAYKRSQKQVEVGWGKYYGPMVEKGTTFSKAQPHMLTTFNRGKDRYFQLMQNAIHF